MKRLFLLISIFILCLSISMFADILIDYNKPAIRNTRLGIVYTNFDIAADNAISGDTFELGLYSDTEGWILDDDDNAIKQWLNLAEPTSKTLKTFEPNPEYQVNDEWIFDNSEKGIKLIYKWYFETSKYNKPILDKIVKYGIKK